MSSLVMRLQEHAFWYREAFRMIGVNFVSVPPLTYDPT